MSAKQIKRSKSGKNVSTNFSMLEQCEPRLFLSTTVLFREGGGTGYTDTTFDDTSLQTYLPDNTHGTETQLYSRNNGDGSIFGVSLVAVKDLFSLLPATSGQGTIHVTNAKLHLFNTFGTSSDQVVVYRMTNGNWLPSSAGTNEDDATYNHADKSANVHWAGGGDFSTSDYTTTNGSTATWSGTWFGDTAVDVTNIVADIYSTGNNYGFAIRSANANNNVIRPAASECTPSAGRPVLEITYEYVYDLTVTSGSGDGSYVSGTVVNVSADAAPTGKVFSCWTGDTQYLANVNAASTTFTMPGVAASITATYAWINRTLTVNNGTGDGTTYHYGEVVNIAADPAGGYLFYNWSGADGITDVNDATTTFTMPNNDVTIYANCSPEQNNMLKLREGTGTGYTVISMDDAELDTWQSDTVANGGVLNMRSGISYSLLGSKELFTLVPQTLSGQTVTITSAKLHLFRYGGTSSDTVYVDRMLSDWLTGSAGTNEADVTYAHRDKSANLHWASGSNFSASDYTTTNQASIAWSNGWGDEEILDITAMMADIYSTGNNYGFALRTSTSASFVGALPSETGTITQRPYIEITYNYGLPTPMHYITVEDGTATDGKGNAPGYFWEGESVDIEADTPTAGQQFNMWIGDVGYSCGITTLSEDLMPISQDEAIIIGGTIEVGDKFIVTVNGHSLTVSATSTTTTQTCIDIVTAVNASGDSEIQKVTAKQSSSTGVELYADAAGTSFTLTLSTTESNGSASDGQTFTYWTRTANHIPATDNIGLADTHYLMPDTDVAIKATYRNADAPDTCYDWWPRWQPFVEATFGADEEPLAYTAAGGDDTMSTSFEANGEWTRASTTSAVLGFETNLPTTAYIEYGLTASYGSTLTLSSQSTYLHQAFLTGLSNNTTYHYRIVATDERRNVLTSTDKTITTAAPAGTVVYLSGGTFNGTPGSAAYTLNQANTTYILTGDVTADYTAFNITANGITLDFGGHTVIYNNVDYQVNSGNYWDYINNASCGIKGQYRTSISIYNGTIIQGDGFNDAGVNGYGYNPIMFYSSSGEVAGISAEYYGSQMNGFMLNGLNAHHNVLLDHGGEMLNRQQGVTAIMYSPITHHNLVLRARQGAIGTMNNGESYDNETYTDSICTNSSGIGCYNASHVNVHDNRIFGSGYMMNALTALAGCSDINIHDNFVHLQAVAPDTRWMEYGPESGMYVFRTTWGGDDIAYTNNIGAAYARDGGQVRGAWIYSSDVASGASGTLTNCVLEGNIFQTIIQDDISIHDMGAAVAFDGDGYAAAPSVIFRNNRLISNLCNVMFGDPYGTGTNGLFYDNTLVKVGSRADYRTVQLANTAVGHKFFDTVLEGGASFSSVVMPASGTADFSVGWSLHLDTGANATVTIRDAATSAIVFTGTADANGDLDITDANGNPILLQYKKAVSGTTNYSYNIESIYGGNTYALNGVIVDELDELRSL